MPGISIGISASTQQAQKGIAGIGQSVTKLAREAKQAFGGANGQGLAAYNKSLVQLQQNLERTTQRVKALTGAQAALIAQAKQLQSAGPSPALNVANRAVAQNARSLTFWQAKQMGAQAQLSTAQNAGGGGNGGGAGMLLSSLAGRYWLPATLASAAAGAVTSGMSIADREQKLLADLLPRQRLGGLAGTDTQKLMNRLRGVSRPLGYSGVEALGFAQDMAGAGGTFGHGLERDTQAAMQAARLMGLDAGGLAAGGRMGAFQPGNARRFANMLAQELKATGMGGRASEVEEATLSLLSRQMQATGAAQPAIALGLQATLAKTGVPGLMGAAGAGLLSRMDEAVKGATDDPSVAFIQSALRDQLGVRGFYKSIRMQERGILGDNRMLPALIKQAFQTNPNADSAKLELSRVLHVPLNVLDRLPLQQITPQNAMHYARLLDKPLLAPGAGASMGLTGNQLRIGDAAKTDALAKVGGPIVKGLADLSTHAVHAYDRLTHIMESSKTTADKLSDIAAYALGPAYMPKNDPRRKAPPIGGYSISPDGKVTPYTPWGTPILPKRAPRHNSVPNGFPAANATIERLRRQLGPPSVPPVDPRGSGFGVEPRHNSTQRSSIDINHHLHDHTGGMHPEAKQRLLATLREALREMNLSHTLSHPNQRYPHL